MTAPAPRKSAVFYDTVRQQPQPGPWAAQAACAGINPGLWFPDRGEPTRPAKAVCASCPVCADCLEYALENRERFGIWGGKSERERRTMRGQRYAARLKAAS